MITHDNWKNLLAKEILGKASKKMCAVGELLQEFLLFLLNEKRGCRLELLMREYMERNCSTWKSSKTSCKREAYPYLRNTVPYRTTPKFLRRSSLRIITCGLVAEHPQEDVPWKQTALSLDSFPPLILTRHSGVSGQAAQPVQLA